MHARGHPSMSSVLLFRLSSWPVSLWNGSQVLLQGGQGCRSDGDLHASALALHSPRAHQESTADRPSVFSHLLMLSQTPVWSWVTGFCTVCPHSDLPH